MLDVTAGQGLRFQLINAATIRFFRLILTDEAGTKIPLIRVGGQGGLLDEARKEGNVQPVPAGTFDFKYTDGEILLDPGDRAGRRDHHPRDGRGPGADAVDAGLSAHRPATGILDPHPDRTGCSLQRRRRQRIVFTQRGRPRARSIGAPVEALGAATANLIDPATFSPAKTGLTGHDRGYQVAGDGQRAACRRPSRVARFPRRLHGHWT